MNYNQQQFDVSENRGVHKSVCASVVLRVLPVYHYCPSGHYSIRKWSRAAVLFRVLQKKKTFQKKAKTLNIMGVGCATGALD